MTVWIMDAYNQGCEEARFFLEKTALLYRREDKYREDNLSRAQIKEMRNDSDTDKIVNAIESEMYDLLALPEKDTSPLLRKALNYLHKFWKQLFAYRNDGEYSPVGHLHYLYNLQAGKNLFPTVLLQILGRTEERSNGLRKPAANDDMSKILVKII